MNGDLAEALRLDAEELARAAATTEAFALREPEQEVEADREAAETWAFEQASLLSIAGSYWSIVDISKAIAVFAEAAGIYARIGHPFAQVTGVCGALRELPTAQSNDIGRDDFEGAASADLLGTTWEFAVDRERSAPVYARLEGAAALEEQTLWPVGRLGLPFALYVDVCSASVELLSRRFDDAGLTEVGDVPRRFRESVYRYLLRTEELVAGAMADTYHWRGLHSSLLPVEPEAIALCATACLTARTTLDERLSYRLSGSPVAMVPLLVGEAVADSIGGDEPNGRTPARLEPLAPFGGPESLEPQSG
jgi:hypothetical protein